jgi:hypothetical protein
MLKKWNLRPDQVQIVQLGSSPAMLVSLDKGGVDAAVLTMPTFFLAEEKGYRLVGDPANMDIFYLQNTLESTRLFLRNNRDRAVKFMKVPLVGGTGATKKVTLVRNSKTARHVVGPGDGERQFYPVAFSTNYATQSLVTLV